MYFIDPRQAHTYLTNNFRLYKSTNGWYNLKCPFCNELVTREKLAVNFETLFMKCWVCTFRGTVVDFVSDYEEITVREAVNKIRSCKHSNIDIHADRIQEAVQISDVKLPFGYTPIMGNDGAMGRRARTYLVNRGFDLRDMDKLGIGYCNEAPEDENEDNFFGYLIIPFKRKGQLVYYIGRDFIGNFLRYKNPAKSAFGVGKGEVIFNDDALDLFDKVYTMEGWADAATLGRHGTSTQGWSFSNRQRSRYLSSPCGELVFVPDAGQENGTSFYERAVQEAMNFLDAKKIKVLDLNKIVHCGKDVNDIGRGPILELEKVTPYLSYESATEILMDYVL